AWRTTRQEEHHVSRAGGGDDPCGDNGAGFARQRRPMTVTLIVAAAKDGVIGRDGDMPWRLATDMKRCRTLTTGHPIVMGRRTWESFPKPGPLPGRTNIVVTRDRTWRAEGAIVAHSLDAALAAARAAPGGDEIY